MTTSHTESSPALASEDRRRLVRYTAAALSALVAVLYLVLLFLVRDAEISADVTTDTTWGAYLFLAVPYVVGAVLLGVSDRRSLCVVGAAVQVLVVALFVMFGVGLFGPEGEGVFEYEALSDLPMELLAALVTGAQVVLFGVLTYLSLPRPPAAPVTPAPG